MPAPSPTPVMMTAVPRLGFLFLAQTKVCAAKELADQEYLGSAGFSLCSSGNANLPIGASHQAETIASMGEQEVGGCVVVLSPRRGNNIPTQGNDLGI